jgi:ectoine hydrolase
VKIELFSKGEFARRVGRTKERMQALGIDLLLVSSPANQFWLTGYDGWSFYTPQMVLVALEDEEPIWFGRRMDAVGAGLTVFMGPDRILSYSEEYIGSRDLHPMQYLADIIKGRGWTTKWIGVEKDDYYYTARWHEILTAALPDAQFEDASLLVNWARMRKSVQEIEYLMEAGTLAANSIRAAVEACDVGVRQCDVVATLYKATIGGTPTLGGTFPCKPPNAMVNEMCSAPHLSWTDAPLRRGDLFYIEQAGVRHRYHAPLARCVSLGTPAQEIVETAKIIIEGLESALGVVRPGVTCDEVEAAWRKCIARHGLVKESRIGYPVGIGYPPTWTELTCSLRKGDHTVLEPGMTFHCVPAIWLQHCGVVVSESFVVTDTGVQCLASLPRELFVKDAV